LAEVRDLRAGEGNDRPFDVFVSVDEHRIGPGHTVEAVPDVPRSAEELVDAVGQLAERGVTWTRVVRPKADPRSLDAYLDDLQWVAEEVVASCR
jgi:hypothetical protein